MAQVTLGGNPVNTNGNLPETGSKAPDFTLAKQDLSNTSLADYAGKKVILNIFPSVDTDVCAASVRKFNEEAGSLNDTAILCISQDLPFAQARFCGAEGIGKVETLSGFRNPEFGKDYGVTLTDGPFAGLDARAVVVIDENGIVKHTEMVKEIGEEPDYQAALTAAK
jgi:thioredoxin-dependent peroxiredoxin